MKRILIYGYGNPGRKDDGLGICLAEKIKHWAKMENLSDMDVDTNYQLNIEDAEKISNYDEVIFVDASKENIANFDYTKVNPSKARVEFTMHAVSPAYVLNLCNHLFKKNPFTNLLHIKGYEWDFEEGISRKAYKNLEKAFAFLTGKIKQESLIKMNY